MSAGWAWEHAACFYFGGMLIYKVDPADGQEKLFYNNGKHLGSNKEQVH